MKKLAALAGCALLGACANTNTGEISYRRAAPPGDLARADQDYQQNCPGVWGGAEDRKCTLFLEARLDRQNVGFGRPIQTGDVYSIRLDHGLIASLSELGIGQRSYRRVPNPLAPVGEIVVLANVFEFGDQNPRFLDPSDVTTARVIYFSNDVSPSQDLNFSNIPLLAPSEYGGNPVGIQIIVLELDRTSGPAQSLIRRLAELGTSSGLIPGGPVAETLLSLGSSLLEQNSDDMIFEYRMVLDPASTGQAIPSSAPFEEGRYVLLRTEFRNTDMLWQNLRLDHNDGRLYEYPSTSDRPVAMANRTYFTVNVVKHPAGTRPSGYAFDTLATFNENLERAMNERAAPLSEVNTVLTRELARVRARSLDGNLGAAWTATMDKARLYSSYLPAAGETCTLTRQAEVERDQARIAFYNNAISFIEDYNSAKGEKVSEAADAPDVLDVSARRAILSRLVEYFAPFNNDGNDPISPATLSDVNAFERQFLNAPTTFANAVLNEAMRKGEVSSCARLVADGKVDAAGS